MNLSAFMNRGIGNILKTLQRYYLKSAKGRAFIARMLPRMQKSARIRTGFEERGTHIPSFLIASIASQCNLHCTGCYARANGACASELAQADLSTSEWQKIFRDARDLGIPFILLAGGEPFMRKDVIEVAADLEDMIFPIFTNGTMIDEKSLALLDEKRHLIPVFSIEGEAEETDRRRGAGISAAVYQAMDRLAEKEILFGASITVTRENIHLVTSPAFVSDLRRRGCGALFFVEYVPAGAGTEHLVLREEEVRELEVAAAAFKEEIDDMILLSFPGDEAAMGGCLASGRGFFHVNATGGAEPCPFSPYAKQNLKTASIQEVLESNYFAELREVAKNAGEHSGGCTLFTHRDKVMALQ